jgi:hypothetical protein
LLCCYCSCSSWGDIIQNIALLVQFHHAFTMLSAYCTMERMQPCPAAMPGSYAQQPCPAAMPGSHARQPCPAAMPGSHARQPCPAAMPGSFARQLCSAALQIYYKCNNRPKAGMQPCILLLGRLFSLSFFRN